MTAFITFNPKEGLIKNNQSNSLNNTSYKREILKNRQHSKENGAGVEWNAEGVARTHGDSDVYYKTQEIQKA